MDEWWGLVLKPTIDAVGHKRHEVEDAREIIQSILVFDVDEDKNGEKSRLSNHFSRKILDLYLSHTKIPTSIGDVVSPDDEYVSHELESILTSFGRRKPKELLTALDDLFVQKEYRLQALNLLSAFVRLQPPHLHLVLETSLVQHLEKCLMVDTSSTVIELALMVLIMLLPHITSSLTTGHRLCKLFLIYSRILCWDKFEESNTEETGSDGETSDSQSEESGDNRESDMPWEKVQQSVQYSDNTPPGLLYYFTFLYGLFPLNFMNFIRKPRKYLKALDFPGANDFYLDQDLIHSRTEPYRRVHLMHPNMFTTTVEDELTENRWIKSDPADVVTECMDLCVAVSATLDDPGPPPTTKLPDLPVPRRETGQVDTDDSATGHEGNTSWRNTQSTMFAPSISGQPDPIDFDSFPKPRSLKSSKSASPLLKSRDPLDSPTLPPIGEKFKTENVQSFRVARSLAPPQRTPSPRLEGFAQALSTTANSPTNAEFQNQSMASLQREIMLLRNDLNFERYLKLQHLSHIGQLQRRHIKEATAEAETQNLINTNRTLKARLAKANELYAQLKKETLTSRSQSKKWEGELSSKVRSYREDQKVWHSEEGTLRTDLQQSRQECEQLRKIVEKAEAEGLKAQQRMRALEYELEDYGKMRRELESVQEKVLLCEDQGKQIAHLMSERDKLRNELEITNMRLNSREMDSERSRKQYERKIMELESRIQSAERGAGKSGQLPHSVQQMLDNALAKNQSKLQQMKAQNLRLLERYTELEIKYHELEGERQADYSRFDRPEKPHYVEFGGDGLSRQYSTRSSQAPPYDTKYVPQLSTQHPENYDFYDEYTSPTSAASPSTPAYSSRPVRHESLAGQQRDQNTPAAMHDFSAAYETSLNNQFQSPPTADIIVSSGKSSYSVDSNGSKGEDKKKVTTKSEVRHYGRGGAQNIGKKVKEKDEKKKQAKSGGFRGLKGMV